ncbi:CheW domain protein [Candidatus Vecturithrix granuli]|uniref:CheW domain protein n=1 Tax=Vecturithrix granuli TaxID=1499967 RepID=A0A0S6W5H0_VECG1|nr:CheW domain protein [Candidatus Vecturithrix granuli]
MLFGLYHGLLALEPGNTHTNMQDMSLPLNAREEHDEETQDQETIQVCVFELSGRLFGLSIFDVQEILEKSPITPVPTTPGFLKGVINLRGNIVPVADIREILELPVKHRSRDSRIMILNFKNAQIGILVDAVTEVRRLEKRLLVTESIQTGISDGKFIANIIQYNEGFLVLLNLQHLYTAIQL